MKPVLCLLALTLGCPFVRAAVLHAITDELPATAPPQTSTTTQTVRGGTAAFRHVTRAGGDATEFVIPAARAGDARWYGWSTQLPADFEHRGRSTLVSGRYLIARDQREGSPTWQGASITASPSDAKISCVIWPAAGIVGRKSHGRPRGFADRVEDRCTDRDVRGVSLLQADQPTPYSRDDRLRAT